MLLGHAYIKITWQVIENLLPFCFSIVREIYRYIINFGTNPS